MFSAASELTPSCVNDSKEHFTYLCVKEGQRFSRVQRDEHLHEELLVLCLQRQREPVNDTANR